MKTPPRLRPGQVSLAQADINAGHVLKIDGELFLGTEETFLIFDLLADAQTFIKTKMKENRDLEFLLYNSQADLVEVTNRLERKTYTQK